MERSKTTRIIVGLALLACTACSPEKANPDEAPEPLHTERQESDSTDADVSGIDTNTFEITTTTVALRARDFPSPGGRVVNIMVIGVDSRLGDHGAHADANHLVRCFLDSGMVEILSIPRDTEADAGFPDTTDLNRLTNVRSAKGRKAYLNAVSEITGVSPIHYYVEFGFSQAVGLLELIGYKSNAISTLRVLRSRQAYRAGDFQRAYNQGRFIRSILLREIPDAHRFVKGLLLRGALSMVETNLPFDKAQQIAEELVSHGFNGTADRSWVRLEPPVLLRVQAFDFDSANIEALHAAVDAKVSGLLKDSTRITTDTYERQLQNLLAKADAANSAASVIRLLQRPFEQRAWMQVTNRKKRGEYREHLCRSLEKAYRTVKNVKKADAILEYMELEMQLEEVKP